MVALLIMASAPSGADRRRSPAPINAAAANQAFVDGDYARAITLYSALLNRRGVNNAERENLLIGRGYAYMNLNRPSEAAADLRQALILNPND